MDRHGLPVRLKITAGTVADCTQAQALIRGLAADHLLVDKAYDSNERLEICHSRNIGAVIPPKASRSEQRDYNQALYKLRHLVENACLKLKQWRGIATRYAKTTASFLAECQIVAMMLWLH